MTTRNLRFKPGPGGWVEATWQGGRVWVRFETDENRKLRRLAELRVPEPTADSLRRIPLARIETAVAAHSPLHVALALRFNETPPPDLRDAFAEGEGVPFPRRYRLKRPATRRLEDAFYVNVARAYRDAARRGMNPRQTIAADAGAAPDTVAGWVQEARRRGHLRPARPGKVGEQP
jgi:hypothetical protein